MEPVSSATETLAQDQAIQLALQYQLLAEAIPQIVWTADPDGYNDYFNDRWFEYTGLTKEETYRSNKDAMHPDDVERYRRAWEEAVRSGEEYEIEYRFRRAEDSTYRWFLGRAIPVKDEGGRVIKWFGTCTDIHDQKMAQRTVEETNQELERKVEERTRELREQINAREALEERDRINLRRLQYVMDNMQLGALLLDENLTILQANERLIALLNLPLQPQDLPGRPGEELFRHISQKQLDPFAYRRALGMILHERMPTRSDLELASGRLLERDYVPITVDGQPRGHLFLYRDVTQERRIDASKSEFMALASHQLRTPLTAIRWTLGKLSRLLKSEQPDVQFLVEEGRKAAARMASTIDTMLTISRIEAGKVSPTLTDVHLRSFLDDLRDLLRPQLLAYGQKLVVECPDGLFLLTDGSLLREIVRNLITNAIKYSPHGATVTVRAEEGDGGVRIHVIDQGLGIPADQQRKVFSKFFRGSNVIETETNGSGLGLYLVHSLVRILHADITFSSREGEGTTFTFTLPHVMPEAL